ncbi:pyridoxal phosphate-dependent aminotransferase [Corynebacterium pelargi]|uniref:Putative N-succinyldiaminopimelate aminotransferase DapC n=1 Tax=Corynebacterium pelargi TaxID=1471400 RepID=A0A410WA57_9CORY|nr:pyridoxal phosphate-dependent aminotransferase [Corynebacterium pelargi]QAU52842.1 putative N-succinyldiaminopimelate aminotransferase DapC [Corynebacterium pelargi]GGG79124.1 aminotransferase [Corynebacterium pelargi]
MVARLEEFQETIFATMSALAQEHGAVNLGQGFPDEDGPEAMLAKAQEEIAGGNNQYAPGPGMVELREAIAAHQRRYGITVSPDQVLVTVGATEAISASVLGLVEPGKEVIVIEPFYDAYAAAIALAGAKRVAVPLRASGRSWDVDVDAIEQAIGPDTAMIIINNPHNPTGSVISEASMLRLAQVLEGTDIVVLSDEVYEHLLFDDQRHRPTCTYPGMAERTITVSSAAKTFNATGWKTGWAIAPPALLSRIRQAKQYLTYVGASCFQPAVAYALEEEMPWVEALADGLERKRTLLADALEAAGFEVHTCPGTYYLVADFSALSDMGGREFCEFLVKEHGVAAIPIEVFCDHPEDWEHKIRFAFCKKDAVIEEAATRLAAIKTT